MSWTFLFLCTAKQWLNFSMLRQTWNIVLCLHMNLWKTQQQQPEIFVTFFNNKKKYILHKNIKYVFHEITLWEWRMKKREIGIHYIHLFASNANTMSIIKHRWRFYSWVYMGNCFWWITFVIIIFIQQIFIHPIKCCCFIECTVKIYACVW